MKSATRRKAGSPRLGASTSAASPEKTPSAMEQIGIEWRRERGDLDLDHFLFAIYLMRLGSIAERAYDGLCKSQYGISGGDMRVLLALRRGGAPYIKRPTDLFRALPVTSGAITKKVDRLERGGYAQRVGEPGVGGGYLVRLTAKGLRVVEDAVTLLSTRSIIEPAIAGFSSREIEQANQLMMRMITAMEEGGPAEPE